MTNAAYQLALTHLGTKEKPGAASNPVVDQFYIDAAGVKHDDSVPWCAAFVGAMLVRTGGKGTGKLTARSYLEWGEPVAREDAREGDIVIFRRGKSEWQGHVGFLVKDNGTTITVLGGNQSDAVTRHAYAASALLGIRRAPKESIKAPAEFLPKLVTPSPAPAAPKQSVLAMIVRALLAMLKGKAE